MIGEALRYRGLESEVGFINQIFVDAPNASCPAFGGKNLNQMFVTTALQGMNQNKRDAFPLAGGVFSKSGAPRGQAEHRFVYPH